MDRWRATSPSICYQLLPSEIQSSSSPPSLLPSPSSPPASLLPSTSRKRSRSPSPSLPPSPLPSPPPSAVPPPPKHIESVGDDIESPRASLASAMQETMTLYARVGLLEQHDVVTRGSLRIARGKTLHTGAETAEQRAETQQVSLRAAQIDVRDLIESREADRLEMAELRSRAQDIEASFWDFERHLGP
ncbi:hypothetical protein Tco_0198858 [Tanacetum coccineum]